jgi:hypothetical protein
MFYTAGSEDGDTVASSDVITILRTSSIKHLMMLPYHHPQNQQYKTSDDATVSPSLEPAV